MAIQLKQKARTGFHFNCSDVTMEQMLAYAKEMKVADEDLLTPREVEKFNRGEGVIGVDTAGKPILVVYDFGNTFAGQSSKKGVQNPADWFEEV